jgi:hypothetical protein
MTSPPVPRFEGSGQHFKISFLSTIPSIEDDRLAEAASVEARLSADHLVDFVGWQEVTRWTTAVNGDPGLFDFGTGMDLRTGRYTTQMPGVHLCSANVQVVPVAAGYAEAIIALNGLVMTDTGMHAASGVQPAVVRSFSLSGVLSLNIGDFVSVWVHGDGGFAIGSQSGFSCGTVRTLAGFAATLEAPQRVNSIGNVSTGWTQLVGWETSGLSGRGGLFELGGGFDAAMGRYTAASAGVYYASAHIRLGGADSGHFGAALRTVGHDDEREMSRPFGDHEEDMIYKTTSPVGRPNRVIIPPIPAAVQHQSTDGSSSPKEESVGVSGVVYLDEADAVTVWVYADEDTSYTVSGESGFSLSYLGWTEDGLVGFLVNLWDGTRATPEGPRRIKTRSAWTELAVWHTIFERGAVLDEKGRIVPQFDSPSGRYTVATGGVYLTAAHVAGSELQHGPFSLMIAFNGDFELPSGLQAVDGRPSAFGATLHVAGLVQLQQNETLSVWVGGPYDATYVVGSATFSAVLLAADAAFSVMQPDIKQWRDIRDWATLDVDFRPEFFEWGPGGFRGTSVFSDARKADAGRYTIDSSGTTAGIYLATAKVSLSGANYGDFDVSMVINGNKNRDNGLTAHVGSGPYLGALEVPVSGLVQLGKGDYLSVSTYATADLSYSPSMDSAFSLVRMEPTAAAAAAKVGEQQIASTGWTEIVSWGTEEFYSEAQLMNQTFGEPLPVSIGLFNLGGHFDSGGRYSASDGSKQYLVAANILLEGCGAGIFGIKVAVNGRIQQKNGLQLTKAAESGKAYFNLNGLVSMQTAEYLSVWAFSSEDDSFSVSHSGFSVSLLGTSTKPVVGFSAGLVSPVEIDTEYWTEVKGWTTEEDGTPLFSADAEYAGFDGATARYTLCTVCPLKHPTSTVFMVSASLVYTGGNSLHRSAKIVINGELDVGFGIESARSARLGSDEGEVLVDSSAISGVVKLEAGDYVSLWVKQSDVSAETVTTTIGTESGFSLLILRGVTNPKDGKEGKALGFKSDLTPIGGWSELSGWNAVGSSGGTAALFNLGVQLDPQSRRYTAQAGIHLVSATVNVNGTDLGYFRLVVALNGVPNANNGMHAIDSNPSAGFADLTVSGVMKLADGDFISVWVYADADPDYTVDHSSGFSCAKVDTAEAFAADLQATQLVAAGNWTEVVGWGVSDCADMRGAAYCTSGTSGRGALFELGGAFEPVGGRFTAYLGGVYYVAAQIRLDGAAAGNFTVAIAQNGGVSAAQTLRAVSDASSPEFASFSLSGAVELSAGDFLSVWVGDDNTYTVNNTYRYTVNTQSGFSCVRLTGSRRLEAVSVGEQHVPSTMGLLPIMGSQEHTLRPWSFVASVNFSSGVFDPASGVFTVVEAGVFVVSPHVTLRFDANRTCALPERVSVATVVNGDFELETGLATVGPSRGIAYMGATVLLRLQAGDRLKLMIRAQSDTYCGDIMVNQSTLTLARIDSTAAAAAVLHNAAWYEVPYWETFGEMYRHGVFYRSQLLDMATGRLQVETGGVYLVSAQLRVDGISRGFFRVALGLNGPPDLHNGLQAVSSRPSPNFAEFSVSGLMLLAKGDFVSVWVYAHESESYTVHSQSGFSCARIDVTGETFAADLVVEQEVATALWVEISGWETNGAGGRAGLFDLGVGFDAATGRCTTPEAGTHYTAAQIRVDSGNSAYFQVSHAR